MLELLNRVWKKGENYESLSHTWNDTRKSSLTHPHKSL